LSAMLFCCSQPVDQMVIAGDEEEPRTAVQRLRAERERQAEWERRGPSTEAFDSYCKAHLQSMERPLAPEDLRKLVATMHQHPRSKDRLKAVLDYMPTLSLTCAELGELMRMVSLDDHKREVMIEMYSHLTDREHFEEQVVHQFSLSDTLRSRTIELLQEKLTERSKEFAQTGSFVLPVSSVGAAAEAKQEQVAQTGVDEADEAAGVSLAKESTAQSSSATRGTPPASSGLCLCCGGSTVDTTEETGAAGAEQAVDDVATNADKVEIAEAQEGNDTNLDLVDEDERSPAAMPQKSGAEP